MMTIMF